MGSNRAKSLAVATVFVALLHVVEADPDGREQWLYLVALPLGYGHLLGGLLFARRRIVALLRPAPIGVACAIGVSGTLTLLAVYTWVLQSPLLGPLVVVALLFVSAWHIVENDLELSRAYRNRLMLSAIRHTRQEWAVIAGAVALLSAAALATPSGASLSSYYIGTTILPPVATVADLATLVLLYHAASWVQFFRDRARNASQPEATALRWRLFWLHVLPLSVNAVAYAWIDPLFVFISMPTLYLFWSSLHAFQTAWVRSSAVPA